MADTKISDLAAVTDVQDTDEFVLARAGVTNKIDGVYLRGLYNAWAYLRDQKTNGTAGGTSSTGNNTRVLQTEVDPDGIVTLSSNQFTLQAGSYRIAARAPAWITPGSITHQLQLRNVTDSTTDLVGPGAYVVGGSSQVDAMLVGRITIAGAKTFELRHWISAGYATQGLGVQATSGEVEVYAEVEIWREA